MLQSPAKRRKISENKSFTTGPANRRQSNTSNPSTPTRASYQSPTKASLARSHPHLVRRSSSNAVSRPSRRSLRSELLGIRDGETANASNQTAEPTNLERLDTVRPRNPNTSEARPPLQPRQPSTATTQMSDPRDLEQPGRSIVPRLVSKQSITKQPESRQKSNEPDLPPTPVQLGIGPVPERPRGLASSSSPRGSKSGSGRQRRRIRDAAAVTSSPLKPKANPLVLIEKDNEPVEEAQESEVGDTEPEEEVTEEVRNLRTTLDQLQIQLESLRAEAGRLETALDRDYPSTSLESEKELLTLLQNESLSSQLPKTISGESDLENTSFLTLFAPANLQISVDTASTSVQSRLKVVHTINITAPPPWPPHVFSAGFEVIADIQDARVEGVHQLNMQKDQKRSILGQTSLQAWISKRLQGRLHHLDVGSLIWCAGKYFEEMVRKAKVLRQLDLIYGQSDRRKVLGLGDELTRIQALALAPYLYMTQIEFYLNRRTGTAGKKSPDAIKVMLQWQLDVTWTGIIKSKTDIAVSGIPIPSQRWVKEVFDRTLNQSGLVLAFSNVWDLIANDMPNNTSAIRDGSLSRQQEMKRKRK